MSRVKSLVTAPTAIILLKRREKGSTKKVD
jgi:hypothetical protein